MLWKNNALVQISTHFERKITIIFLTKSFSFVMGALKNRLNETVLLSTQNICFGTEIKKKYIYSFLIDSTYLEACISIYLQKRVDKD